MLVVLAGLPGTGKTTLARLLARQLRAAHLRVDAIEAAMQRTDAVAGPVGAAGYAVAREVAGSCLAVATPVVVDAVNPVPEARRGWLEVGEAYGRSPVFVEVVVGDRDEHRRRVQRRSSDVAGLVVPTWEQVCARDYRPWDETRDGPRLRLDNDGPVETSLAVVLAHLESVPVDAGGTDG